MYTVNKEIVKIAEKGYYFIGMSSYTPQEELDMKSAMIRLPLSKEMRKRLLMVEVFLEKTKQSGTDAMMVAHAAAVVGDFLSCEETNNGFYTMCAGIPLPISLRRIREDMRAKSVGYLDTEMLPVEIMEALDELKGISKEKDEAAVVLLGIGCLSEMIEAIESGSMILYGYVKGKDVCLDEYEPHVFEKYRPAMLH